MTLPRANLTDVSKKQGKDVATIDVRAASKPGAILTARIEAIQSIPLREQEVLRVKNLSNTRFLNKWKVEIRDRQSMVNIGQ